MLEEKLQKFKGGLESAKESQEEVTEWALKREKRKGHEK